MHPARARPGSGDPQVPPPLSPAYLAAVAEPTAAMTESEISEVIAAYARSAANARTVGFDGVAIHGAHGYLIDSFLWQGTNLRTDRYGGSPANRVRLGAEIVRAIRSAVGPEFPIVLRYSQWKLQDYEAEAAQQHPQELEQLLGPLAAAGVDLFEASTRIFWKPAFADSGPDPGGAGPASSPASPRWPSAALAWTRICRVHSAGQ